jgi:hypothetical protein
LASPDDRQTNLYKSCGRQNNSSNAEETKDLDGEKGLFDEEVETLTLDGITRRYQHGPM